MRTLVVVCLLACSGAQGATVIEVPPQDLPPSPQSPPPPRVDTALMHTGDEWVGTYICAQGQTDLALHVDNVDGEGVDVVFQFSHSPTGAAGAYKMHGTIDSSGRVELVPGPWLQRPSNYVTVGMSGSVRGDGFAGRITNPSCTTFSLHRR